MLPGERPHDRAGHAEVAVGHVVVAAAVRVSAFEAVAGLEPGNSSLQVVREALPAGDHAGKLRGRARRFDAFTVSDSAN